MWFMYFHVAERLGVGIDVPHRCMNKHRTTEPVFMYLFICSVVDGSVSSSNCAVWSCRTFSEWRIPRGVQNGGRGALRCHARARGTSASVFDVQSVSSRHFSPNTKHAATSSGQSVTSVPGRNKFRFACSGQPRNAVALPTVMFLTR